MLTAIWDEFLNIAKDEAGSRVVETWLKALSIAHWDARQPKICLQAPNNFVRDWVHTHYLELLRVNLSRLLNVTNLQIELTNLPEPEVSETLEFTGAVTEAPLTPPNLASSELQLGTMIGARISNHGSVRSRKTLSARTAATITPFTVGQPASPVPTASSEVKSGLVAPATAIVPAKLARSRSDTSLVAVGQRGTPVNSAYRFDNFIIGSNNTLAHAAAQAVAQQPGGLYNPLFIYGASGLGKTHLLHAIGNEIATQHPRLTVLYQTTDRFVSEFISAIRFNKVWAFKEKYRLVDLLLIDDIQFISNKEQTQEAFFHIFNALYEARKQIILTSDTYPSDILGLAERLRSRLEWGLITDIHAPALETKIAILKKKAEQHQETLSDELASFIAAKEVANVRELEGALVRVLAFANLTNQPLSLGLAQKVLGVPAPKTVVLPTTLERIVAAVSQQFAYDLPVLRSEQRAQDIVLARQIAMYLMKQLTDKSLREIGLYLNRKDHTTVSHAIDKITTRLKTDGQLQQQVDQLIQLVNGAS